MAKRILIKGGHVLSMDPDIEDLGRGDVLIEDDVITDIGQIDDRDAQVIDAEGTVVIPGFVDGHRHLWQTFLRAVLPDCTMGSYMGRMLGQLAPHVTAEDSAVGTMLGALECLNAGITTVFDWSHALASGEHNDARIRALLDTQIRGYYAPNGPATYDWYSWEAPQPHPDDITRIAKHYFGDSTGRLRLAAALRSPGQVPDSVIVEDWALARSLGIPISIHAGVRENDREQYEAAALADLGLLGNDVSFAHANMFNQTELSLVAAAGASVVMSPYAELICGHGPVRYERFVASGIKPGLSADATAVSPGDMFTQMRAALGAARAAEHAADESLSPSTTARAVLAAATRDGARAIGLGDVCGSLTPGKAGDVVLIRADAVATGPLIDPVGVVVAAADTAHVDTVIVGGRLVKQHGRLLGHDVAALLDRARSSAKRVIASAA